MSSDKLLWGVFMDPHIPFFHRCKIFITFWAITIPLTIVVLPLTILAILNPLWFRDSAFRALQDFVNTLAKKRSKLMKPMLQKYKLFDTLKSYNSNNVGSTASKNP